MLNIVVPMAGRGSRFADAGFDLPKPLIPVLGRPMIEVVIHNIRPSRPHRFIFICQHEHMEKYGLAKRLQTYAPGSVVVEVPAVTEGAACTVLVAHDLINNQDALMIANSDQWCDVAIDDYLAQQDRQGLDGLIMTMTANDPKWSFVRLNKSKQVTEVVEKKVVSNEATVGIYNFKAGRDFVGAAEEMIAKNLRVNGEFYVAPAYNQIIERGAKVGCFNIGAEAAGMYGLGIPADLAKFESLDVAKKATTF